MSAERIAAALVACGLLAAALLIGARTRRRIGLIPEPLTVFLLSWSLVLALFALPWIHYVPSSLLAWVLLYGAIATFVAGALVAYRRFPLQERGEPRPGLDTRRLFWLWLGTSTVGLVGLAGYVHAVDVVVGWRALISDLSSVRAAQVTTEFKDAYGLWRLLTNFAIIGFLLWTVAFRVGVFRGALRWVAPLGLVGAVGMVLATDRTLLVTVLLWTAFFHAVYLPVQRARRLALVVVLFAVLGTGAFLAIGAGSHGQTLGEQPEIERVLSMPEAFRPLAYPYVYVTSAPPTLSQLLEDPNRPHTGGGMTLLPLVKIASRLGIAGAPPEQVYAFYPIPFDTYNILSWVGPLYLDFGPIGVLLLPMLLGFATCAVASFVLRRRTFLGSWCLAILLLAVLSTPIDNKVSAVVTWELVAVGLPLGLFVERRTMALRGRLSALSGRARRAGPGTVAATVALALAFVVVAVNAIRVTPQTRDPANTPDDAAQALRESAVKVERRDRAGGLPSSEALASQLHASDPGLAFEGLARASATPADPGVIGVHVRGADVFFAVRDRRGTVLTLRSLGRGARRVTVGPAVRSTR